MEMLAVIANTVVRRAVEIIGPLVAEQLRDLILRKKDDPEDMLREAAKEGRDNLVGALIEAGADVNAQSTAFLHKGKSALIWAAEMNHSHVVRLLLNGAVNVDAKMLDGGGKSALMVAAECGHSDVAKILLDGGAKINDTSKKKNRTALMYAAKNGRFAVVKLLVEREADLNLRSKSGKTALSYASKEKRHDIRDYLQERGASL